MSKYFLKVILFSFSIIMLFYSCSNQFVEKEFNSKTEYYSKINNVINDREAEIKFANGRSVNSDDININENSVFYRDIVTEKQQTLIPVSNIKDINIKSYVSQNPVKFNGSIELKNDSIVEVKNAVSLKGTISFSLIHKKMFSSPIDNVSSFSFDNHWKGMMQYAFAGMFVGGVIGYKAGSDAGIRERSPAFGAVVGSVLFGLSGMIAGVIIGSPQSYLLKNNDTETYKFLKRFGLIGGLTSSTIFGGFSDNRFYVPRAMDRYSFGLFYLQTINSQFQFRPEIIYSLKGGNYDNYPINQVRNYYFYEGGTSAIYLNMIEVPLLLQFETFAPRDHFLNLMAGPAINFPFKCELDEFYIGPMDEVYEYSEKKFHANTYLSMIFGLGIKWDRHFSTEFMYDQGLTKLGNAIMTDGTILKLKQKDFLITTTFSL